MPLLRCRRLISVLLFAWHRVLTGQISTCCILFFFANKTLFFRQEVRLGRAGTVDTRVIHRHSPLSELKRSLFHKLSEVYSARGDRGRHARISIARLAMHLIPGQMNVSPAGVSDQLKGANINDLGLFSFGLCVVLLTLATSTLGSWLPNQVGIHLSLYKI